MQIRENNIIFTHLLLYIFMVSIAEGKIKAFVKKFLCTCIYICRYRYIHTHTFSQDRGISRYTVPPCTTKRRTTTNFKTKHSQNIQKIQLYGSLGVKEEIFIQTGKRAGDGQSGQRKCTARQQLVDQVVPHLCEINREEQLGSETDNTTHGSGAGE